MSVGRAVIACGLLNRTIKVFDRKTFAVIAVLRGHDVDKPRNLAKSVTVE